MLISITYLNQFEIRRNYILQVLEMKYFMDLFIYLNRFLFIRISIFLAKTKIKICHFKISIFSSVVKVILNTKIQIIKF